MPKAKRRSVRDGGTVVEVQNSGLEVWLYDEANRETIAKPRGTEDLGSGGMPPDFDEKTREGLIVGYSLMQDDAVSALVYVGDALTEKELSVARWLEPQTAFLQLPSGALCIESNDASRIGPEEPGDEGAIVNVPKGNYKLTLYRVDHEALDREGMEWTGAQELIVLTPGGTPKDAATELLPFEHRRDTSWVGKYSINGKTADALIWFPDHWDTFILNLDSNAVAQLGLSLGSYLRTTVPSTGHTLITTYGASWDDARRIPRPSGVPHDELGLSALLSFQDWNGAEGMFCRREKTTRVVEDEHKNIWMPCTVEVLDVKPQEVKKTERGFTEADFATKTYYEMDSGFLSLILSDVLTGVGDLDELALPQALKRFDKDFGKLNFKSVGDVSWVDSANDEEIEFTVRLYTGRDDCFAAIIGQEANIHVAYLSEKTDGQWIITGLLDDLERAVRTAESRRPKGTTTTVKSLDESLASILEAHETAIEGVAVKKAPTTRAEAEEALKRFLITAFR